jgi:hypothetical protein
MGEITMHRHSTAALLIATAALFATACGSDGSKPAASSSTSSSSTSSTTSTTAPPVAVAGETAWVDATAKWKQLAPTAFAKTPAAAAEDLAALLRGGGTSETGMVEVVSVQGGEPAVIVIRETGLPDDSVYSATYEITMQPGDEGWVVGSARVQYGCLRGVDTTDDTRCV